MEDGFYFRPAGVFAKVNRIVFTRQGNKFGLCDGDGNTALWQVAGQSIQFPSSPFNLTPVSLQPKDFPQSLPDSQSLSYLNLP